MQNTATTLKTKLVNGINKVSNAEYHADKEYLSSSSLKLILESAQKFYNEKILGNAKPLEGPWLAEGTLTHSLILEPETVATDFAFFEGMRKQGAEWDSFLAANTGKLIMSKPQKERCNAYYESYKKRKSATELIKGGEAEHTICGELNGVKIKVRCDYINIEEGYIVDVKTTGFPSDVDSFKLTINEYQYDLSAALYLKLVEQFYGKPFSFFFLVLGKKDLNCEVFKLSAESRKKGEFKILAALQKYVKCLQSGDWSDNIKVVNRSSTNYEIKEV